MASILIGFNNRADAATLAGGSFASGYPLNNLKSEALSTLARTATLKRSATRFRSTLATNYALRAVGIRHHNLSEFSRWRVRAGQAPFDVIFDSEETGGIVDDRLTFSGGTNGTRVNKRGVIVRCTRTNLLLRSAELDNAAWNKTNVTVTANDVSNLSPDGTATMEKIIQTATNADHVVWQQVTSFATGAPVTFSAFVKAGTVNKIRFALTNNVTANSFVDVDISTGGVFNVGVGVTNYAVEPQGGGLWRLSVTAVATGSTINANLYMLDATGAQVFWGNTSNYFYAWGAQLEENGDMTDYIPTTTVAVTATMSGRINYGTFRTNQMTQSESFEKWTLVAANIFQNEAIAPDGTRTMDKLVETTAATWHAVQRGAAISAAPHTVSVYAKPAERSALTLYLYDGTNHSATFDLNTGEVITKGVGVTATATPAGDGIFRCSITYTPVIYNNYIIKFELFNGIGNYAGDGVSGVYIWGAQVEEGSVATEYIPTTFLPRTVVDECEGLLVEATETNALPASADFAGASWTKGSQTMTANTILAPDGAKTADLLVESAVAATTRSLSRNVTIAAGERDVWSIFVKRYSAGAARHVRLQVASDAGANGYRTWVNMTDGTLVSPASFGTGTLIRAGIEPWGDGWYRVQLSGVADPAATTVFVGVYVLPNPNGGTSVYDGDGVSGMYFWGAQFEQGTVATSYIPTAAAAVTRTSDSISTTSFGYNSAEGTLYVEAKQAPLHSDTLTRVLVSIADSATFNESMYISRVNPNAATYGMTVVDGGVGQIASGALGAVAAAGSTLRAALAYRAHDFAGSLNGSVPNTDSSGTLPMCNTLVIGNGAWSGAVNQPDVCIKRATYWPARLSNAALQSITASGPDVLGYDSGWQSCLQFTFGMDVPSNWGEQYDVMAVLPEGIDAAYISVEFDDPYNTAAYLEMGRLYVMGGIQPTSNAPQGGYQDGREDLSSTSKNRAGRVIGFARRRQRYVDFTLPWVTLEEAAAAHELQDLVGTTDEVLFIPDPDNMARSQRYGFLGHLSELSPLDYPFYNTRATKFRIKEKL